ncbi:MAG: hypothetical protein COS84_08265 [Armatimonadetes bacterium CG07_land_8_20_14_0_80_40_9]|nr:MAG: hypothetical protein COS84_08265 [Armatimonadetes bacterium CG07_land_8_20_14_0_80_40_9]
MAIRLKVRLEFENKKIEAVGLANAGYETDTEEILLPASLFKKYWKGKGKEVRYLTADGQVTTLKHIGKCKTKIITKDKTSKEVIAELLVSAGGEEVILSDALLQSLGIILVKLKDGKWCFENEDIERESETIQRYT